MLMKSYKNIIGEIKKLQALADKRRRAELASIISNIRKQMTEYGITIADIKSTSAVGRKSGQEKLKKKVGKRLEKTARDRRAAVAPKYRDPDSGATWSGRGLTPKWLVEKEKTGKSRAEYLIQK